MNAPYSNRPGPYPQQQGLSSPGPYGANPYNPPPPYPPRLGPRRMSPWIWVLLGAVLLGLGTCGGFVGLVALGSNMEPGGVMLGAQIPDAKRTKLRERGILKDSDQLVAFYDASISLDMSELVVLTSDRLTYANGGRVTTMPLEDIVSIDQRVEGITGDVIEVASIKSDRMRIEVAHLNNGVSLLNAIEDEVQKKRPTVTIRRQTPR